MKQGSRGSEPMPLPRRNHKSLDTPVRITEQEWADGISPLVTIICYTYNHVSFIRDAIEGFLMQETTYPVEILIHDDASTDGTSEIVKEYQEKYPRLIGILVRSENIYNRPDQFYLRCEFEASACGQFVALCEGDDYWTAPDKLQKHADFLLTHSDYSLVADNSMVLKTETGKTYPFSELSETDIDLRMLLDKRPFGTAAVMYRAELMEAVDRHFQTGGDIKRWCYLSVRGRVRYFPEVTSVYRRGRHGAVEGTSALKWALKMEHWNKELEGFLKKQRVLKECIGKEVFRERNYHNFSNSFFSGLEKREFKTALISGIRCLRYSPSLFFRSIYYKFVHKLRKKGNRRSPF